MDRRSGLLSNPLNPMTRFVPTGAILSLLIFAVTYFTYYFRHQSGAPGSYLPLVVGMGAFFALMSWFNYFSSPSLSVLVRLLKAVGIALAESVLFFFLLLLLVLNTIGA